MDTKNIVDESTAFDSDLLGGFLESPNEETHEFLCVGVQFTFTYLKYS
jgi:hypothetical protein